MVLEETVQFWHWLALGGILGVLEILVPGFVLIWLGLAAVAVGCLMLVWPGMDLHLQLLSYAILTVLSVGIWFRWIKGNQKVSDQPNLNRRGQQLIGRRAPVIEAIVNGRGRVKLGDSTWRVTGPDLPAGQMVEVTGVEGTVLEVRPVDTPAAGDQPPVPASDDPTAPPNS